MVYAALYALGSVVSTVTKSFIQDTRPASFYLLKICGNSGKSIFHTARNGIEGKSFLYNICLCCIES